ncbi:ABC transporter ATP-binding protein [Acidiferrobacter sp.]|uniref:ABC transporter ATP-binding protein n=1 Tax=Acidiferrobacter sp. TaxID=1872107 RepID=UPI00260402B1|nr:ATP-binding cassette domain-containing protein [Acidiferrobacter sp.]
MSHSEVLVETDVVTRFYGRHAAVSDMSFMIRRGEVLGFLGPNGAGKTTTMQMLSGNLAPSSGRILIAGHDMQEAPEQAKAHLGYLPEYPPLYREFTVDEYLDYAAALRRIPRASRRAARERAKARCGLHEVGGRLTANLSKGFQQRVGLAQAIIHDPDVVILDEPTVGLDPIQIREVRALIRELGSEHAVILSTHILPEVQASCDRVQIIHKGRLVLNEDINTLMAHMESQALIAAFRAAPDLGALGRLPQVHAVTTQEDGRVRILHEPGADPTDAIVGLALEKGWGLREINPEHSTLESIFVELTGESPEAS